MELSQQVISLELAKKLKELGVKQDGMFVHVELKHVIQNKFDDDGKYIGHDVLETRLETGFAASCYYPLDSFVSKCSAFTVAELGDILPNTVLVPNADPFDNFRIVITKFISIDEKLNSIKNYIINYECDTTACAGQDAWLIKKLTKNIHDPNLANAMAKMLIYLIENGFIKNESM